METALPSCSKCQAILPAELFNAPGLAPCPSCTSPLQVAVFPALFRPVTGSTAENLLVEGQSSCFYHAQKKAVLPCDSCGRFLCALCDVEFNGQHICPSCLDAGKNKGKIKNLQQRRTRHDSVALSVALLPMLIFYLTIITAPIAIYLSIKHWNSPGSVVAQRSKVRFIIAITVACLQIVGWIVGIYLVAKN